MKLGKLIKVREMIATHSNEAISVTLAYKMMKFMKASDSEDAFYITKIREIIEKYKDPEQNNSNDGKVRIQKGKETICQTELNDVENTEVEAPNIQFSLSELEELKLTVQEVFSLDEFIIEEA